MRRLPTRFPGFTLTPGTTPSGSAPPILAADVLPASTRRMTAVSGGEPG